MKTFQIEDAKTRFFKSKEDYLKFKQAWKNFHNDGHVVEIREVDIAPWGSKEKNMVEMKIPQLHSGHYMLYNLLRGYEVTRGYAPLTNKGRLEARKNYSGDSDPWASCINWAGWIFRTSNSFKNNLIGVPEEKKTQWSYGHTLQELDELMKPFGDTISMEAIIELGELLEPWVREPHEEKKEEATV